jgi:hypothetical protein
MSDDDLDEDEKAILKKLRAESAGKVHTWFERCAVNANRYILAHVLARCLQLMALRSVST